jgi:hypothetical protein
MPAPANESDLPGLPLFASMLEHGIWVRSVKFPLLPALQESGWFEQIHDVISHQTLPPT